MIKIEHVDGDNKGKIIFIVIFACLMIVQSTGSIGKIIDENKESASREICLFKYVDLRTSVYLYIE